MNKKQNIKETVFQSYNRIEFLWSAARGEKLIMRLIGSAVCGITKLRKGLKNCDVKMLYFQNEFENLTRLSPQNEQKVYTQFKSYNIDKFCVYSVRFYSVYVKFMF